MLTNYDVMGNEETRNPPTFLTESLFNPLHNLLHMLAKSILMIYVSDLILLGIWADHNKILFSPT